jgi:glycosyltransferase involved in cell wall biosynthesis
MQALRQRSPAGFGFHSDFGFRISNFCLHRIMRFLMLNWRDPRNPKSGGAERVTQAYLAALVGRGHEVAWFANDFPGAAPGEVIQGVRVVRGGGFGSSVLAARRWYRQQPRFDLVMDQHHGIPWYSPWWCGTNHIAYIHEVLGPIWSSFYRWPVSHIGRWQERWTHWLYRRVPFWTACESTVSCLRRHGVKHITIIRYGVNTSALPELEAKPITQPLKLAVVSRLAPNKRIAECLRTLAVLRQRGVAASLRVVGTGESESALKQEAAQLQLTDVVKFTGPLPEAEKDAILRDSHLLLHTSVREGWGLNVIEANAMGTPATVYPVEGLIESTLHDRTGAVATGETPAALADQIISLLADDARYQRYRRAAWDRAKTMHWNKVLPQACDWLEARGRGEPLRGESGQVAAGG